MELILLLFNSNCEVTFYTDYLTHYPKNNTYPFRIIFDKWKITPSISEI